VRPSNIVSHATDYDILLEFSRRFSIVKLKDNTGKLALPRDEMDCPEVCGGFKEDAPQCISETGRCRHFHGLLKHDLAACKFEFNYAEENS